MSLTINDGYLNLLILMFLISVAVAVAAFTLAAMSGPTASLLGAPRPTLVRTLPVFMQEAKKAAMTAGGLAFLLFIILHFADAEGPTTTWSVIFTFAVVFGGMLLFNAASSMTSGECHDDTVPKNSLGEVMTGEKAILAVLLAAPVALIASAMAFNVVKVFTNKVVVAMANGGVISVANDPAARQACRVEDLSANEHIYSINGQSDYGLRVQAKVTNLGAARTFRVTSHMTSGQGTWDRQTTINFGKEQALIVTLDFPEPTLGIDLNSTRYEVTCIPTR